MLAFAGTVRLPRVVLASPKATLSRVDLTRMIKCHHVSFSFLTVSKSDSGTANCDEPPSARSWLFTPLELSNVFLRRHVFQVSLIHKMD